MTNQEVRTTRARHLVHASLLVVVLLVGCAKRMHREVTQPNQVETLDHKAPYLKIHTRRGEVYVLNDTPRWQEVSKFARFPRGMPRDIDRTKLTLPRSGR